VAEASIEKSHPLSPVVRLWRRPAIVLVVLGAFALGLFVRGLWIQPETSSAAIAGRARAADPAAPDVKAAVSDPQPPPLRRAIDTALLPLVMDTIPVSVDQGIAAGSGGGLAVVGGDVIAVDRLGAFVKISGADHRIEALHIPAPPNHVVEYNRFAATRHEMRIGFRVHDIEARSEGDGVRLFVSYERYLPARQTTALTVSTVLVSGDRWSPLGDWEDIYEGQPLQAEWYAGVAGGGRLLLAGDRLYLTVGDYNQDNVFIRSGLEAQNPDNDFGKILSIDLATRKKTVLTIGHRNPQGLTVTLQGTLYATEHGPKGGDALNRIVEGKNYGWPIATFGTHYTTYDWPNSKVDHGAVFEKPVFAWVPSIAVSNLIEIANLDPAWNGDLLVGSLKARSLYRLRRDESGRVIYSEPVWIGERVRDLASMPDGTVVMWTDEAHVIFLGLDVAKLASNSREIATSNDPILARCEACHHIGPTHAGNIAPSLSRVFERPIASDSFEHYSVALKSAKGVWSREKLLELLTNPGTFSLGAAAHEVSSKEQALAVIEALRRLD
jgi:cytochrome c2